MARARRWRYATTCIAAIRSGGLLVLMVNCRNRAAVAAYKKAGFIDTGELHAGGRAGPQHLMLHGLHGTTATYDGMGQ